MSVGNGIAIGYEPPPGLGEEGIRISVGECRRISGLGETRKARLLALTLELGPLKGARLVVLGREVHELDAAARAALRARVAFLPAHGGLLSSLNAWENIVLPLGFHRPKSLPEAPARVHYLLDQLGADPNELLPKLPERMNLYEKKLTAYVRILIGNPELVLVEELRSGLAPEELAGTERFSGVYKAICPGGTLVLIDGTGEAHSDANARSPEVR